MIKQHLGLIVFICTLILILVLGIIALFLSSKGSSKLVQITPTPIPTLPLAIVKIQPPQDPTKVFFPIQQVSFEFNQPIELQGISYKVEPSVETSLRYQDGSDKIVILSAKNIWHSGITFISLLPDTIAKSGAKLNQTVTYQLNTGFPTNPDDKE